MARISKRKVFKCVCAISEERTYYIASSTIHWWKCTCKCNMESSAVFDGEMGQGLCHLHMRSVYFWHKHSGTYSGVFCYCFRNKGWEPLVKQTWRLPDPLTPNVGRPENIPDFLRCLQLHFSPQFFRSSFLFSTICWILESSCSLFEDRILALQRKTDSLFVKIKKWFTFLRSLFTYPSSSQSWPSLLLFLLFYCCFDVFLVSFVATFKVKVKVV